MATAASERIREEPRYGLEMLEHLSTTVQQLDKIAGSAQAKEEMLRQAPSWRVAADDLLPNQDPPAGNTAGGKDGTDDERVLPRADREFSSGG